MVFEQLRRKQIEPPPHYQAIFLLLIHYMKVIRRVSAVAVFKRIVTCTPNILQDGNVRAMMRNENTVTRRWREIPVCNDNACGESKSQTPMRVSWTSHS